MIDRNDLRWYRDAIIYQLHVKSFFDANNDGIGDFGGLTAPPAGVQDADFGIGEFGRCDIDHRAARHRCAQMRLCRIRLRRRKGRPCLSKAVPSVICATTYAL